jgi:para-nitrobenzyl esterase
VWRRAENASKLLAADRTTRSTLILRTKMRTKHRVWAFFGLVALLAAASTACSSNSAQPGDAGGNESDGGAISDGSSSSNPDATALDGGSPIVTTEYGPVQGRIDQKVYAFKGIPYAQPPIGPLRWKGPQKPTPWTSVFDASNFGKRCAQTQNATLQTAASTDEDCLYLNVWTPNPSASKLPVMVWIHGGGNVGGSASDPVPFSDGGYFYSGASLAANGTVVVSLNYRLGIFGFFPHPALIGEGSKASNQGLWDQRFAMQWVQDNIAMFGGDPNNVTIFGESAGSLDVCLHVASPQTPPLFERAISESGGCTTHQPTLTDDAPLVLSVAAQLGCPVTAVGDLGDGGLDADVGTIAAALGDAGADSLSCMRKLSVQALLAAPETDAGLGGPFSPVVDDDFLADQPRTLYQTGKIAKTPYLLGSNNDEGTLFVLGGTTVTDQAGLSAAISNQYGDASASVAQLYPVSEFDGGIPNPYQAALTRIIGDSILVCSTYDSAILAANQGAPVYTYNFDVPVEIKGVVGGPGELYLGASHGSELSFVFGTSPQFATDPAQDSLSKLMERYWTRFAKSGDPNGGSDLKWPTFSASSNERMQFTLQEPTVISNFRSAECTFWIGQYQAAFGSALSTP